MLVYATEFYLKPEDGLLEKAKAPIKTWLGKKLGPAFRPVLIIPFNEPFTIARPGTGQNEVRIIGTPDHAPDYCLSITDRHLDAQVSGRAWFTRIGLERSSPSAPLRVTILLETSEVSPQAAQHPVTPTKPGIVSDILNGCEPDELTPGKHIRQLSEATLSEFQAEIADPRRRHPIIVISPDDFTEQPLLDEAELARLLVGLAQVYVIDQKREAWRLRNQLPPWHTAWDGSVTVISPERAGKAFGKVYRNDEIEAIRLESARSFERFLFEEITHRSNLPLSRRHIGDEWVGRRLIAFKIAQLKEAGADGKDWAEFARIYEEERDLARKAAEKLEFKLEETEESNERLRQQIVELENKVRSQQWHLKNAAQSTLAPQPAAMAKPEPASLTEVTSHVLEQFADQLELTSHAEKTLKKSPYEDVSLAWGAFKALANQFHAAFTQQLPMQEAIASLREAGGKYASNNSEFTAGRCDGYERTHAGKKYTLNKHLQLGSARDPRYCFRLYFEWEPAREKIIVLHAGEHLDTLAS